jgi:hypothetical protein
MHTYSVELVLPEEEIVILSKFEMDLPHTSSVFMSLLGQDKKPFQLKHLRTVMHAFLALHRRHMRQGPLRLGACHYHGQNGKRRKSSRH